MHTSAVWLSTVSARSPSLLSKAITKVVVGRHHVSALLDSGSSDTFIKESVAEWMKLELLPSRSCVTLASSNQTAVILGHCFLDIKIDNYIYKQVRLSIMANLCPELILGRDFMAKHSGIFIKFGGNLPSLNICGLAKASTTAPTLFTISCWNASQLQQHLAASP